MKINILKLVTVLLAIALMSLSGCKNYSSPMESDAEVIILTDTSPSSDLISYANTTAKQVHTAVSAALTKAEIAGETFTETDFANADSGDAVVELSGCTLDLSDYLGDSFSGYFYASVNPDKYLVNYVLWSESPISDDYKHQYSYSETENIPNANQIIGCYPFIDYTINNTNASQSDLISYANDNAKQVHTAISAALTLAAIAGETFTETDFSNTNSRDVVVELSGCTLDLSDYLGDNFLGYFYVSVDPETYCVNYVLWSESPISDDYKYRYSLSESEYIASEIQVIGCYPGIDYTINNTANASQSDLISYANDTAKQVYASVCAALTLALITEETFTETDFSNANSGDTVVELSGCTLDLSDYLGDNFLGYFYVSVDPQTYCVHYVLWSESPISDDYKYQYSLSDSEYIASEIQVIGCYPCL